MLAIGVEAREGGEFILHVDLAEEDKSIPAELTVYAKRVIVLKTVVGSIIPLMMCICFN